MSGYTNDECEIPKIKSYPGADKEIASEIDYSIVKEQFYSTCTKELWI